MQIIDTCKAYEGVVSQSVQYSLQTLWGWGWPLMIPCSAVPVWRIYLYLFAVIRFAFNLSITLNDNWMDQSVHRTLNPLEHCLASIFALFFLFHELREAPWAERLSRGWLTADSSNYLLLISAKTEERRKLIINNPSREWHWAQIRDNSSTSF